MPVSGLVIRLESHVSLRDARAELGQLACVELGDAQRDGLPGVIDAPDYPAHDAALAAIGAVPGVCAVDIVFHDFSDVTEFGRLPAKRRASR